MEGSVSLPVPAPRLLACAALAALGSNYLLRLLALRWRLVSGADTARHGPGGVPLLGGFGVLIGLGVGLGLAWPGWVAGLWIGLLLIGLAAIGTWDDFRGISPRARLLAEGLLALGWVALAARLGMDSGAPELGTSLAGALALAFLVVAGANAFNMCDNADGLAAGCGTITFLSLYVLGMRGGAGNDLHLVLALAGSGALLGFLFWNRPPARLYLGDVGSLPLGGLLAFLLASTWKPGAPIGAIACIAGYFLFDPLYVIAGRLARRRSPLTGGVDHPSHDLRRLTTAWPFAWVTILLVHTLSVVIGAALFLERCSGVWLWLVLLGWAGLLAAARRGRRGAAT